jgi:polar amino acid transport system substrate-binding protein
MHPEGARPIRSGQDSIVKKLVVVATLLLASAAQAEPLKLVTEEYPPFSYREAGVYKGVAIDQVNILMKEAGLAYSIEMMPWARALALAETQAMTCVFTTVHSEERDKRFKWVEPLMTGRTILIRKAGSAIDPATVEQAAKYVVGTQRGDFTVDLLKAGNFTKIDLASDFNLTMKKLLNGRIDLMPISERYYDKLRREGAPIEYVLLLAERVYSIACDESVPDRDIARMQAGLDKLIASGAQEQLYHKYGLDNPSN